MLPNNLRYLRQFFPAAVFNRGMQYKQQARVELTRVDADRNLILSSVKGAGQSIYGVRVTWTQDNDGYVIDGECSCPVHYNCKHVVATLLEASNLTMAKQVHLDEIQEHKLSKPIVHWLENLKESQLASAQSLETCNADKTQLIFVLTNFNTPSEKKMTVKISLFKVILNNQGKIGRTQKFNLSQASNWQILSEKDAEILYKLEMAQRKSEGVESASSNEFIITDVDHDSIIEEIINTGRCYWQKINDTAITLGAMLTAELKWQMQDDGSQELRCEVSGRPVVVLALAQPRYLDENTMQCGLLKIAAESTLILKLLNAPKIEIGEVELIHAELKKLNLTNKIPKLNRVNQEKIQLGTPIPCLYLFQKDMMVRTSWESTRSLADLSFLYGNAKVSWHESKNPVYSWDKQAQCLIPFMRNAEAENQALLELERQQAVCVDDVDFIMTRNPNGHYFLLDHDRSDPVRFGLVSVPALQRLGWQISYDDDYAYNLINPELAEWYVNIDESSGIDWFDFELGIEVNGERINLLPFLVKTLSKSPDLLKQFEQNPHLTNMILPLMENKSLPIPIERLKVILLTLLELHEDAPLTLQDKLRLSRYQVGRLIEVDDIFAKQVHWMGGERLQQLAKKLHDFTGLSSAAMSELFIGELRPYQQTGVDWLQFLREYELAGVLADDMGLGKTVQTLAHLAIEKSSGRMQKPCLIVAPTSLMFNWQMEARRFVPSLKVLILQGNTRKQHFDEIKQYDLVLTTYPLLHRDKTILLQEDFHYLILDEAQGIKNPKTHAAAIVQKINTQHRLCLTGTPMENHLGELWSIFNFLMPGFLGTSKLFSQLFRMPIERKQDAERQANLLKRITPFVLRRTKDQILKELPPKVETCQLVELNDEARDLYETIRLTMQKKVTEQIAAVGMNRSHIMILDALLKLRQICCDHRLLKMKTGKTVKQAAAKLTLLLEMLEPMLAEGRKILVFSQFTEMLALIEAELKLRHIHYTKLTGSTKDRATPVNDFQQGKVSLFLISLKAGGVGLNLTAADTVIHYDPWWNPAVETQATDRAHRIGQTNTVFVYKLIVKGTVEEKIVELQQRKKALVTGLLSEQLSENINLTTSDLDYLFAPLNSETLQTENLS